MSLTSTASGLAPRRLPWVSVVYVLLTLAALVWSLRDLHISSEQLKSGGPRLAEYARLMFGKPAWNYLPKVVDGLRESIQIAGIGTAIAAVLALPFGALAARNLSRIAAIPLLGKFLLNLIRTFPELILAIAFIKAIGPGPFAGVLAVGLHSVGMMGKLYAERIETVDEGALEALSASGASPLEVFWFGILPEVAPDFLSFALYRFDLNVRAATVLGLVGAGGIGTLLQLQQMGSNWPAVGVIIIGIILTVGVIDFVSAKLRARLT